MDAECKPLLTQPPPRSSPALVGLAPLTVAVPSAKLDLLMLCLLHARASHLRFSSLACQTLYHTRCVQSRSIMAHTDDP